MIINIYRISYYNIEDDNDNKDGEGDEVNKKWIVVEEDYVIMSY